MCEISPFLPIVNKKIRARIFLIVNGALATLTKMCSNWMCPLPPAFIFWKGKQLNSFPEES